MSASDIRSPELDLSTIPDLSGKVAIVTGAYDPNSIGYNVVEQLALKGAKVFIGARSLEKAGGAVSALHKAHPSIPTGNLQPLVTDLNDLKQVKSVAQSFAKEQPRLDIVVNNAGLLARPLDKTEHGISVSMNTNHLGPFLFTLELLPLLKKTAASNPGVRVVNISSTTHALVPSGIKFDTVESFNAELGGTEDFNSNLARYGLSKLANILFTKELQKRFDAEGVPAVAITLHPGGVRTPGSINFVGPANLAMLDGAMTPLQGALTPIFAAASPEVWTKKSEYAGKYLMPYGVVSEDVLSENAKDAALASALWATSEKAIADVLAK